MQVCNSVRTELTPNRYLASEEIPWIFWNQNVYYRGANSPQILSIFKQVSEVHILQTDIFKAHFIISINILILVP